MIDKPEVTSNAGIYCYRWQDMNIAATVERITEGSHHALTGEVTIVNKCVGHDELLEQTSLNLTSNVSRNALAKSLTERVNHLDWVSIVKYICVLTVSEYRKGEPVLELGNEPQNKMIDYRLYPIIEDLQPTTIFAPGGSGKSYVADYICVLVQYGCAGLNGKWHPTQGAGNCLYLDWETSYDTHSRRIWAIKKGMGITDSDSIYYRFCSQPLAADIVEIQRIVLERDIKLVVIDSQMAACPDESATANTQYHNALRSLRCTSLTLDHVAKNTDKENAQPYGSVVKWNRARSVFGLWNHQESGATTMELGLYHKKHNDGINLPPQGIKVDFINAGASLDKVLFTATDVSEDPELVKGLSLNRQFEHYLKRGPMSVEDLAEATGKDIGIVRATLNAKRYKDVFINVGSKGNNSWALKHTEDF